MEKALLAWSGGKDCALALHEILKRSTFEITSLLTTFTEDYDRVSMHGIRRVLLETQSESLGIPLENVFIPKDCSNEKYESKMNEVLLKYKQLGVSSVVFGDIFLEDVRKYREDNLEKIGMKGVFPIWKRDTRRLSRSFINSGFKALAVCIDSEQLDQRFAGREYNTEFLSGLPETADPCGENGEFHTFVYDGPIFLEPIPHVAGEVALRESRFYYCELMPAS